MSMLNRMEFLLKIKGEVLIRGTGLNGAKCAFQMYLLGINVIGFVVADKKTSTFRDLPVYDTFDKINNNYFIAVATNMDSYQRICEEMKESGKKEFYDYCYYEWIYKDVVLLHGNCHIEILKEFLLSSKTFSEKYSIYPYPLLVSSTKEFKTEPEIFEHIDLWIHEDIRDDNIFGYKVSDSYIRERIDKNAFEIVIPHLYGVGRILFPQIIFLRGGNEAINDGADTDGIFLYGDKVIEKCIKDGMKIDGIIRYCEGENALSKEEIVSNFNCYLEKIREREKFWDIKISNYIMGMYRFNKLFYDDGHPANCIMEYIAREVLGKLGIKNEDIRCTKRMDAHEKPIYPVVKKVLDLKFDDNEIRKTGKKLSENMDFPEFIKEYCWWRHYKDFQSIMER